jgi:hypothetical protein
MTDLPNWVYDVVIELQRWNYEHPNLYTSAGGIEGYFRTEKCGCEALELVPENVRQWAIAIRDYQRQREANPDPPLPRTVHVEMTPDLDDPSPDGRVRVSWIPEIAATLTCTCGHPVDQHMLMPDTRPCTLCGCAGLVKQAEQP